MGFLVTPSHFEVPQNSLFAFKTSEKNYEKSSFFIYSRVYFVHVEHCDDTAHASDNMILYSWRSNPSMEEHSTTDMKLSIGAKNSIRFALKNRHVARSRLSLTLGETCFDVEVMAGGSRE